MTAKVIDGDAKTTAPIDQSPERVVGSLLR
jgi:hypothetical protein